MSVLIDRLREECYLFPFSQYSDSCASDTVDRLYLAFSNYSVSVPHCETCFEDRLGLYHKLKNTKSVQHIDPMVISPLYYESSGCGGVENWKRFFPRMVHVRLFDKECSDLMLFDRALGAGLWAWPNEQQEALRRFLSQAFVQLITEEMGEPLASMINEGKKFDPLFKIGDPAQLALILYEALLICRIDVESLIDWLLQVDSMQSKLCLLETVNQRIEFWGWGLDSCNENVSGVVRYAAACRNVLDQKVSEEVLINWFLHADNNAALQRKIEATTKRPGYWQRFYTSTEPLENEDDYQYFIESFDRAAQRCLDARESAQS